MKSNSINKEKRYIIHRNYILVICMAVVLFGLSFYCWFKPEERFSESERRVLKPFPKLTTETIMSGKFMKEFESYSLDQFPFRDSFRSLKALFSYGLIGRKDNNGIYLAEGHLSKIEYPMQTQMLDHAATRMEEIYNMYLKDTESTCYFSIVPDKNIFLADENGYLSMDYEKLYSAYYMQVYSYIMVLAKNKDIAEEITQNTFYKAMTSKSRFKEKSNELTWLCSIAKNLFYDEVRKKQRIADMPPDDELLAEDDVESTIVDSDAAYRIHLILHKLEEPYKEVFQLRVFGELSFSQIASIFDKTESWARVTYHRARLKIQERMDDYE